MKTTKLNILAALFFLSVNQTVKAQENGTEEWGPNSPVTAAPCIPNASSWVLGGNIISTPPPVNPNGPINNIVIQNNIGTCNNWPFILKANNNHAVYIQPNSYVGIGSNNNNPGAQLDIFNSNNGNTNHLRIFGDWDGSIEASGDANIFMNGSFSIKRGTVNPLNIASIPFFIDNNDNTHTGNIYTGVAHTGNIFTSNAQITGKLGVNTPGFPSTEIEVRGASGAFTNIMAYSTNSHGKAGMIVMNGTTSYIFNIDALDIGRITQQNPVLNNAQQQNSNTQNLLNFKMNPINSEPQVWIGRYPKAPSIHSDFNFAVDGKLIAKSIYVTLNCNWQWADYVFESDYKLPKLEDVESFYKDNKHLPEIPTANEVKENGIDVSQMNSLLLKKVEELTLYLVQQQKEINELKKLITKINEE